MADAERDPDSETDALVSALATGKVVVVGDLMLDVYIWGDVRRISPEAPVPVVDVRRQTYVAGGAGNTAAGVAALGATVELGGVLGDDDAGARLLGALAERGVGCTGVFKTGDRRTTTKTRVIAHSQQVVRADVEERSHLESELEERLCAWAEEQIASASALVLSDYAKGVVTPVVAQRLIEVARAHDAPIVVDPKGHDYAKYRGATILTPNVHDAEQAAHMPIHSYDDLLAAGRKLSRELEGTLLLITRGADGMSLIGEDEVIDIAAEARDVYDVTGAGDTVVAALAAALACGAAIQPALQLASRAAAIAVSKVGTASVSMHDLRAR